MTTRKDFGLQLALSVTKSDLLHFGYWGEGEDVTYASIPAAQRRYVDEVLGLIPKETRTILDIGCGTGAVAAQLQGRGFEVECVSPDELLNEKIRREHPALTVHCCKFEDFETDRRYDLLLEMESCQYVRLERGFQKCAEFLSPGGAMLISDTFRTTTTRDYKDWHTLDAFYQTVKKHGFVIEHSRDITRGTAPTVELASRMYSEYMVPIAQMILSSLRHSVEKRRLYRFLWSLISRLFRKRIEKTARDFYEKVPRLLDRDNYLANVKYMIFLLRRETQKG